MICIKWWHVVLNTLTCNMRASKYYFMLLAVICLSLPTPFNTNINREVHHLLFMIHTSITGSSLVALSDGPKMHKVGHLQVCYKITYRNLHNQAKNSGVEQHSEHARKPLNQQWILRKLKCVLYSKKHQWQKVWQIRTVGSLVEKLRVHFQFDFCPIF